MRRRTQTSQLTFLVTARIRIKSWMKSTSFNPVTRILLFAPAIKYDQLSNINHRRGCVAFTPQVHTSSSTTTPKPDVIDFLTTTVNQFKLVYRFKLFDAISTRGQKIISNGFLNPLTIFVDQSNYRVINSNCIPVIGQLTWILIDQKSVLIPYGRRGNSKSLANRIPSATSSPL